MLCRILQQTRSSQWPCQISFQHCVILTSFLNDSDAVDGPIIAADAVKDYTRATESSDAIIALTYVITSSHCVADSTFPMAFCSTLSILQQSVVGEVYFGNKKQNVESF